MRYKRKKEKRMEAVIKNVATIDQIQKENKSEAEEIAEFFAPRVKAMGLTREDLKETIREVRNKYGRCSRY